MATFFKTAKEQRQCIELSINALRVAGCPDDALSPVEEFARTIQCEGCDGFSTSGPHGEDSVYLCDDCLERG